MRKALAAWMRRGLFVCTGGIFRGDWPMPFLSCRGTGRKVFDLANLTFSLQVLCGSLAQQRTVTGVGASLRPWAHSTRGDSVRRQCLAVSSGCVRLLAALGGASTARKFYPFTYDFRRDNAADRRDKRHYGESGACLASRM